MPEIIWEIESVDSIIYTVPEATYTGKTEVYGNTYRSTVTENLTQGMLLALHDTDMQQWQAVVDACSELTGATDWTFNNENETIEYSIGDPLYQYRREGSDTYYDTGTDACDASVQVLREKPDTIDIWDIEYSAPYCRATYSYYNPNLGYIPTNGMNVWISRYDRTDPLPVLTVTYQQVTQKILFNTSSPDQAKVLFSETFIDKVANDFVSPSFDSSLIPLSPPDFVCDLNDSINYNDLARSRYAYPVNSPEFDAVVQTIVDHRMKRQCEYQAIRDAIFDIDKSSGKALDVIGNFIGQPRSLINFITKPYFGFQGARNAQAFNIGVWYTLNAASQGVIKILNDDEYRGVIKARVIKNSTRNSRKDLINVLKLLGGSGKTPKITYTRHGVIVILNTVETDPNGLISYFLSRYMQDDTIIPRPMGYRIISRMDSPEE